MERWIAIILGLLVIVVGFLIVRQIMTGTQSLPQQGNAVECTIRGGTCTDSCQQTVISDVSCPGSQICCGGG